MKRLKYITLSISAILIAGHANATSVEAYADENDVIGLYSEYDINEKHKVTGEVSNDSYVELGYSYNVTENTSVGASYVQGGYLGGDEARLKASTGFQLTENLTVSGGLEYRHGLEEVGGDKEINITSGGRGDAVVPLPDGHGHNAVVPLPEGHGNVLPDNGLPNGDIFCKPIGGNSGNMADCIDDNADNEYSQASSDVILPRVEVIEHESNTSQLVKANLGLDYNIVNQVVVSYDADLYHQLADINIKGVEQDDTWSSSTLKATYVGMGNVQPYVKYGADNEEIDNGVVTAGVVIGL